MEDIIALIFLFLILVVPIPGITARLAIKPMVEAAVRLRETFASGGGVVERRLMELEVGGKRVGPAARRLTLHRAAVCERRLFVTSC